MAEAIIIASALVGILVGTVQLYKWFKKPTATLSTSPAVPTAPAAPRAEVHDKWVSTRYIEESGIAEELKRQGYDLRWVAANDEAQMIDLEGWEYVLRDEDDGTRVRIKVRDHPIIGGYLVLLKTLAR